MCEIELSDGASARICFAGLRRTLAPEMTTARHWTDFFDGTSISRGLAFARDSRVRIVAGGGDRVRGMVTGNGGNYRVEVQIADREGLLASSITTECTCPVGIACKHGVALVAVLMGIHRGAKNSTAHNDDDVDDPDRVHRDDEIEMERMLASRMGTFWHKSSTRPSKPTAPVSLPGSEVAPQVDLLPAAASDHLTERWLARVARSEVSKNSADVLLVAQLGVNDGEWQVSPVLLKRKKNGEWGVGKRLSRWASVSGQEEHEINQPLYAFSHRAATWQKEFGGDGFLSLEVGCSARDLEHVLDAGLLFDADTAAGPLRRGAERAGLFQWEKSAGGWQLRLVIPGSPQENSPILLDPVWWCSGREIGPVALPASGSALAQILAMPRIPFERVAQAMPFLRRWLPDLAPPEGLPEMVVPVPILRVWQGPVRSLDPRKAQRRLADLALVTFRYGRAELPAVGSPIHGRGGNRVVRHQAAEMQRLAELARVGIEPAQRPGGWLVEETRLPSGTLFIAINGLTPAGLVALQGTGWDISGRAIAAVRVTDLGPLQADVSSAAGEDSSADDGWFDLTLGTVIDGQRIDLVPLLTPLLRGGPEVWRQLPVADGAVLVTHGHDQVLRVPLSLLEHLREHLLALFAREASPTWRLNQWDAGVLAGLDGLGVTILGGERLRSIGEVLASPLIPAIPPPGLQGVLRPYQAEGLAWLQRLREVGLGGLLADDMGLGKTVQVIAHLLAEQTAGRLDRPCLVICPASLIGVWRRELERFAPSLIPRVLHGLRRDQSSLIAGVVGITTYATLQRDIDGLEKIPLHVAICDEAQAVKNAGAKSAQAIRRLDARQRLALTGTPMENHLGELHAQVTWVAPGLFGSRATFETHYVKPIAAGDATRGDLLRRRLKAVLLRRTKEQVAPELPPRSESVVSVELGQPQRRLYEAIRLAMDSRIREVIRDKGLARSRIEVLEALLRLRQVCCDPQLLGTAAGRACTESAKLDWLSEQVPTMIEDGRRVLLFSQFTSFLDRIEEVVLKPANVSYQRLDGQTRNRQELVDTFQAGTVPLFLLSLKAGGTGLTLTAADTVILADPWWNPAAEAQAADRAHRIGQDKPVFIYRLVASGTIEEKVLALQASKKALADALFDETGQSLGQLTPEDLSALLAPMTS